MASIGLAATAAAVTCLSIAMAPAQISAPKIIGRKSDRIRPYPANPWYWQYRGKPVLLLGGSKDDNLFQIPDLKSHLDEMAAIGANYIRNTMSDRPDFGFEVYPFLRRPDGKYDLEQWNPEYWRRFAEMLKLTYERNIIVQIEVWDRFDYSQSRWPIHPYNPANNVNYTFQQSGFRPEYRQHAGANEQPFFFTTPAQRNNQVVLRYQQRFVDEMLRYAMPYPHVLYCMDNETSGEEAWGRYWAERIRAAGKALGVDAFTTEMWDDWNITSPVHRRTLDHPDIYPFVDVSQNNQNSGQVHWDRFQQVRDHIAARPRPINTVKTYGADGGRFGTTADGLARWWRHLIGGAAAVRCHRPDSGIGLSDTAKASIRAARLLASVVPLWECEPAQQLLRDRSDDEAYAAVKTGAACVVYFPREGTVGLDLSSSPGNWRLRWIDVGRGQWTAPSRVQGGSVVPLRTPRDGMWVAVMSRSSR